MALLAGIEGGPLAALDDPEGSRVPESLPPVVVAHVHLFPDRVFDAQWRWFERHAWPVRYRLYARQVVRFLLDRGVGRLVALHYAHKPGMARALNAFVAEISREEPAVLGLATVFPGEPGAAEILVEAFGLGLRGVKLHCHVQAFAPDEPRMEEIYAVCAAHGRPLVLHAGREPRSPAYPRDPYELCSAERVERVLSEHPRLRLCVPHLGADELDAYARLLERHDNLWLDTTMMLSGFFGEPPPRRLVEMRPERVMYGTDFPNLPYAWDREIRRLASWGLPEPALGRIVGGTALDLFGP